MSKKSGGKEGLSVDDARLKKSLASALLSIISPKLLLQEIGEHLLQTSRDRFDTFTGPDGKPWKPLRPETIARKSKNKDKILTLNGYLRRLLRPEIVNAGFGVRVASDRVYARAHQLGYSKRNLPARPFIGMSRDDKRAIVAMTASYLISGFGLLKGR